MRHQILGAVALVLAGRGLALAQGVQSGTLTGVVTSADGQKLPGATISVLSSSLQGLRTAVSDSNGGYIFKALPPGVYTVTFELTGMGTIEQHKTIGLGETALLSATLSVAAVLVPTIGPGQALARSAKTPYRESVGRAPGQGPGETEGAPAMRLVWFDPTNAAERAFTSMANEVRAVLGGMDVAAHWRRGTGAAAQGEVNVILLASDPRPNALSPRVMGATHKVGSAKAVWIYLPNVARALWPRWQPRRRLGSSSWRALGRALGRVVAHEVVHAVAPALPHRGTGLMSRSLSRTSLLAQRIRVHPLVARRVRGNLATARGSFLVLRAQAWLDRKHRKLPRGVQCGLSRGSSVPVLKQASEKAVQRLLHVYL